MATSALVRAARITVSATGLAVVGLSPATAQTLDLAGANQTINSFVPYNDIFNTTGSATLTAQLFAPQTYAGVLRDNGGVLGLTKTGAGALTLTGANTYTGVTTIGASSRIIAGAANTLSAASLLNTTSTGVLDLAGFNQTINGLVGTGANGGVRNTGALATLTISSATDRVFAGNIGGNTGAGDAIRVVKTGTGLQRFNRASNYTGGTELAAGTLGFGSGAAFGTGAIAVTGDARLTSFGSSLTVANDINLAARLSLGGLPFTLAGVISGAGSLDMTGGGVTLSGVNSFGGGIILNGSGLIVGVSGATGTGTITASDVTSSFSVAPSAYASVTNVTVGNDIALNFASPDRGINFRAPAAGNSLTLDGTISGNGRLFFSGGDGTVIFNKANSFVGSVNVNQGVLGVAVNNALGGNANQINMSGPSGITAFGDGLVIGNELRAGSVVTLDTNGHDVTYSGVIRNLNGGVGSVVKAGAGTLILTGAKTYTGATTVNTGTLQLDGSLTSDVTVNAGATFGGSGSVAAARTVTVADGGIIAPGASAGTLTVGNLVLNAGSVLNFELAAPNAPLGGAGSDLIVVTNNLTLDGTINTSALLGFNEGTYRVINYGNLLANNVLIAGTAPVDYTFSIATTNGVGAGAGGVNLLVSFNGGSDRYWDGAGPYGNGVINGGDGTWIAGTNNWTSASGNPLLQWASARGFFRGAAGTIAVSGTQVFTGLNFEVDGYTLNGGTLQSNAGAIDTVAATTTTINSVISGDTLAKTGTGTLVLNGANSFTGGLTVAAGTVRVGGSGALGTGTATFNGGTTLEGTTGAFSTLANAIVLGGAVGFDANGGGTTLNGVISGTGPLSIFDAGVPVDGNTGFALFNAANTFTGQVNLSNTALYISADGSLGNVANAVAIDNGVLGVAGVVTTARSFALTNNARFLANSDITTSGVISGTGRLIKDGDGTLVLGNAANSYAGGTEITAGVVSVASDGALGALAGGVDFTGNNLDGGPAPVLRFTANVTSARAVSIASGITGTIDTVANTDTLTGAISGDGTLAKIGTGRLILTGTGNSYAGGTNLDAGSLQIDNGGAIGTGSLNTIGGTTFVAGIGTGNAPITLANNVLVRPGFTFLDLQGTNFSVDTVTGLVVTNGTDLTLNGLVTGTGTIVTTGAAGRLFLTNSSTRSGGMVLNRVVAYAGADAALGTGAVTLGNFGGIRADSADVTLNNLIQVNGVSNTVGGSETLTLTGALTGTSTLNKVGTGTLVLAGSSPLTGTVEVNQGGLIVDGALSAAAGIVNVKADALLGGDGSIAGTVNVSNGGILTAGSATTVGSLAIGTLNLLNSSQVVFKLGEANVVAGAFNDQVVVGGALALDGRLTVSTSPGGTFGDGVYNLFTYGSLLDNTLVIDSLPVLPAGSTASLSLVDPGYVNLVVSGVGFEQYWDGTGNAHNNVVNGGNGSWGALTPTWTTSNGALNTNWLGHVGIFQGTAGTVNLAQAFGFETLRFDVGGYILSGPGSLTLTGAAVVATNTAPADVTFIDVAVTGTGSLVKQGVGYLDLTRSNSYAGGTDIQAGTLRAYTSGSIGAGDVAMADGTAFDLVTGGLTFANNFTLAGVSTFRVYNGLSSLTGVISGGGSLFYDEAGTLALNAANTYAGGTTINFGAVQVGNDAALGTGAVTMASGTTLIAGASGLVLANAITTLGDGLVNSGPGVFTLNGAIDGAGSISQIGTGNLVLNGNNSFTGLGINQGTVTVGTDTAAGIGGISINDNATLAAGVSGLVLANGITTTANGIVNSGPGVFTLNGNIDGAGSISSIGLGTLVLNGDNSFTNLGINQGTVQVGSNTAAGIGGISINDNATLQSGGAAITLANSVATTANGLVNVRVGEVLTLNGTVGGTGSISQIGAGNLVLNGDNSFTNLGINQGTVTVGSNTAAGIGGISINDNAVLKAGIDGLVLANAISTTANGIVDNSGFVFTLNGNIGGAGSISSIGAGNLVLNGANSFTNLGINQGTVTVGTNTAAGVGGISINDNATLAAGVSGLVLANGITTTANGIVNSGPGVFTLNGNIDGAGSISSIGLGTLVLNGDNSFTNLGINQGTVTVGTNTAAGIGGISINNNATLAAGVSGLVIANAVTTTGAGTIDSGPGVLTLIGAIGGAGGIAKTGDGMLTLTGTSTYTGATNVNTGNLNVNGALGNTAVTVFSDATLSGSGTIAGVVAVQDGGILSPGNSPGTLTVGGLNLSGGSILNWELGAANTIGGPLNDLVIVNGDLVLDGQLNVAQSAGGLFTPGIYNLISYTGGLTDNTLSINSLANGATGVVQTAVNGQVNLVVLSSPTVVLYWDGADGVGNGVISGGSGTWDLSNTNWTGAAPSALNATWQQNTLGVFTAPGGTVDITDSIQFQGLQFTGDGYVLTASGAGELTTATSSFLFTDGGVTTTITAPITGAGEIVKQGAGTLTLGGNSSFAGGTQLTNGQITVLTDSALGTGTLTMASDTTLTAGVSGLVLANAVTTNGNGLVDSGAGVLTLNGTVGGTGSISQIGAGNL
ncbi:MAG: hypothetical protein DCF31_15990, partial [Alphaproteobacteria bacterium]